MVPFEQRVTSVAEVTWEGDRLFRGEGELHKSARELSERLSQAGVPHALIGAFSLIHYGFRRYTEDLDVLVSPEGLKRAHEFLVGTDYRPVFEGSKNLRDSRNGVRIDVVVAGGFPGDGKPKPIAFPDPASVPHEDESGLPYLQLGVFIELKLASAMTGGPARGKDYSDVYELIRCRKLDEKFAVSLHEYVRPSFLQLLAQAREAEAKGEM